MENQLAVPEPDNLEIEPGESGSFDWSDIELTPETIAKKNWGVISGINDVRRIIRRLRGMGSAVIDNSIFEMAENARIEKRRENYQSYWEPQLEEFFQQNREPGAKGRKSIKVPGGSIGVTERTTATLEFDAEKEPLLLKWCQENQPEAVTTKIEVTVFNDKTAQELIAFIKTWPGYEKAGGETLAKTTQTIAKKLVIDQFLKTGEVPAGTTHVPPGEDFYVRAKADDSVLKKLRKILKEGKPVPSDEELEGPEEADPETPALPASE